jgi:hypothetical protein
MMDYNIGFMEEPRLRPEAAKDRIFTSVEDPTVSHDDHKSRR